MQGIAAVNVRRAKPTKPNPMNRAQKEGNNRLSAAIPH
jgi:hypothetical protein